MVTSTRRGPVPERTPQSSARKTKRALETEDTPTQAKRRKAVERKEQIVQQANKLNEVADSESDATSIYSEIEVPSVTANTPTRATTPKKGKKLSVRTRSSPQVVIGTEQNRAGLSPQDVEESTDTVQEDEVPDSAQDAEFHTPESQLDDAIYATPAVARAEQKGSPSTSADEGSATPKAQSAKQGSTNKTSKTPDVLSALEKELDEEPIAVSQFDGTSSSKVTHVKFGNEESAEPATSANLPMHRTFRFGIDDEVDGVEAAEDTAQPQAVPDEDEDASDSDDAPEEVTVASARTKTKAADAEAAQAFRSQQEKQKAKRKEREDRRAEEAEQKRKREKKLEKKLAKKETKKAEALGLDINNLPALLPDSILEAAGEQRPPTPPPETQGLSAKDRQQEKLNRHIAFLERGEKPIKDKKRGALNVHVLQEENMRLAPKVNRAVKSIREDWLKGRRYPKQNRGRKGPKHGKMERRPMGGGFLRGGSPE